MFRMRVLCQEVRTVLAAYHEIGKGWFSNQNNPSVSTIQRCIAAFDDMVLLPPQRHVSINACTGSGFGAVILGLVLSAFLSISYLKIDQ